MTSKEILEGNKLIAEFMGGEMFKGNEYYTFSKHPLLGINGMGHAYPDELFYNLRWDWIMPVTKKIIQYCSSREENKTLKETFITYYSGGLKAFLACDIEPLWSACVQFIETVNK